MVDTSFFYPGEGPLYRWHPLTKGALLLATILVAFADLLPWRWLPLAPLVLSGLLLLLVMRSGLRLTGRLLRILFLFLVPLGISLFFVQGFLFPGATEVIFSLGPAALKWEGIRFGLRILTRFLPVMIATLMLVLTTRMPDLALALTQAGLPYELAYVFLSAYQLVPDSFVRAQKISDAQRARGLRTEGSLLVRLRGLLPLVGPLITGSLQQVEERALALEARAFRAVGPRTAWRQLTDSPAQRIARWALVLAGLSLFVYGRFLV